MQILHWGILLFLTLVLPFLLGMIPVTYMNRLQRTPAMAYVCGWFVSFSVFELVSVPFILLQRSFTEVVVVYSLVIAILSLLSLWKAGKVMKDFTRYIMGIRELHILARLCWGLVILLIGAQMAAAVFLEYYDGDDAYYVAAAVATDLFDSMYLRDNYTGYLYQLDIRHALSPVPVYQAWLSRVSGIHPAMIAHSVLAPIWLLLMYSVYQQIANRLFPKKREYRPLFMVFLAMWFVFGNISIYTAETFAMTRTWQGKGLMAGIVIPALFLCLLYLCDRKRTKGMWCLFVMVIITSVFATSISFMLVPTVVGVAALLIALREKRFKVFVQICMCCLPCIVLGICYLIVK